MSTYTEEAFVQEVRNHFPFFSSSCISPRSSSPSHTGDTRESEQSSWTLMENAGGSQTLKEVIDRIVEYLSGANVQLRAHNELSDLCMEKVQEGVRAVGTLVNAADPLHEICLGSSATQLLLNLSLAIEPLLTATDEIIVTNCDHESNIGCWRRMAQRNNITVNEWKVNKETFELDASELEKLLTPNTKVVAFTHCSNVLGIVNPVKKYIKMIRSLSPNALVVVDGVAYAPHRAVDVQDIDADFYSVSLYKVYGPHIGLLYGKKECFEKVKCINHFYVENEVPRKMQPGNFPYELAFSLQGITNYVKELAIRFSGNKSVPMNERRLVELGFQQITNQEQTLTDKLMSYLNSNDMIKIIGTPSADNQVRVPTISFVIKGVDSQELCEYLNNYKMATKYGDCYTKRMMEYLGLDKVDHPWGGKGKGVVRISMLHYNTTQEIDELTELIEQAILQLSTTTTPLPQKPMKVIPTRPSQLVQQCV